MRKCTFFLFLLFCVSILHGQIQSVTVEQNNVSGGGFQSDVTIWDDGQVIYSVADVAGVFKSTDGGAIYHSFSQGLKSPKVATIAITPDNQDILYVGTGDKGGSGGLFRSINGGQEWMLTIAGDSAQFAGNHALNAHPIPNGHPRSNGDLIIVDPGMDTEDYLDDIVIAGTYKDGVKVFSEGGDIEIAALNESSFVRGLAHHTDNAGMAYAAIYDEDETQNGIYEINFQDLNNITSTLVYQTPNPEGVAILSNGNVYAAIGTAGIVMYDGSTWNLANQSLDIDNPNRVWTAVTGYSRENEGDVIYIGLNNMGGNTNGQNYSSVWRSENGGGTWVPLVDASTNVDDQVYGQSYDWWFRTDAFPQAGLGRKNSVVSSIDVAQGAISNSVSDDVVFVSGRGGIWKGIDGGSSWQPSVYNMQVTANNGVAINPNDPSQVAIANTDFVVLTTNSNFQNDDIYRDKPDGAESRGYDVIFDPVADQAILGAGDRDTNNPGGGEVYIKSTSTLGDNTVGWVDTDLHVLLDDNVGRVRAVTYGYHDGTNATSQSILAAVEEKGVFRYHNSTWVEVDDVPIGSTKRSNFVWPDPQNSGVVFLLDLSAGLYRSMDGGQTWDNIWDVMTFNNKDFFNTGYITADDNDPSVIYVSIQGHSSSPINTNFKVYRMTDANQASTEYGNPNNDSKITDITLHSVDIPIQRPGPLVFGQDGRLWLTEQQNSPNGISAGLYVMEDPTQDLYFDNHTTEAYKDFVIQPSGIDVSDNGHIYISQSGTGLAKLSYTAQNDPLAGTTFLEAEQSNIGSNWLAAVSAEACNCNYIKSPAGQPTNHLPIDDNADITTFLVNVDNAGLYKVFARVRTNGAGGDSFWVRANQGTWQKWNRINWPHTSAVDVFQWSQVGHYNNGDDYATPVAFNLNEGINEVQFAIREADTHLDKIFVTTEDESWIHTVQSAEPSGDFSLQHLITESCPGDTLYFKSDLSGDSITILAEEIEILKDLHIVGQETDLINLFGSGGHRLFHVHQGAELSLSHLILRNGTDTTDGGAILNEGTLRLNEIIFESNSEGNSPKALTNKPNGQLIIMSGTTTIKD